MLGVIIGLLFLTVVYLDKRVNSRASSEIRVVQFGDEFETQLDAFFRQWHEIVLADRPGKHSQRVNRLSLKLPEIIKIKKKISSILKFSARGRSQLK